MKSISSQLKNDKFHNIEYKKSSIMPIIKRFEASRIEREALNIKKKEFEEIVNFSDIKKGDIYVNLIHYDKNLKNIENFQYYRYFSIKIRGDYCTFDNFNMLKLFISKTNQIPKTPSYILMTSGSESVEVLNEFHNICFITDIIIFCYEVEKYLYLKEKYTKINLITNNFSEVIIFLKTKRFSDRDLSMDNHLLATPLITFYDYNKALFPIHRILAFFFNENFKTFSDYGFKIAKIFIEKSTFEKKVKNKIIKIMKNLINLDSNSFLKNA